MGTGSTCLPHVNKMVNHRDIIPHFYICCLEILSHYGNIAKNLNAPVDKL